MKPIEPPPLNPGCLEGYFTMVRKVAKDMGREVELRDGKIVAVWRK